jgi:CubicO group peptidase (beta-lactamase class C family)
MMPHEQPSAVSGRRLKFYTGLMLVTSLASLPNAAKAQTVSLRKIADTYAGSLVTTGQAVGIGVAIIEGNRPARYFSYGNAVARTQSTPAKPFNPDLLFSIGSVTKVFTTNVLGQRVFSGELALDQQLSDFNKQLGKLKPLTSQVSLGELASFGGGIADFPPHCQGSNPAPGCLPARYPNLQQYTVQDLVAFFRSTVPANYQVKPPQPVTNLPAPYNYSDFSMGLTGLLLGGSPEKRLDNTAVSGWFAAVKKQILKPLEMNSTFLLVPADERDRKIPGYGQALATATVTNGTVSGFTIISRGAQYSSIPPVKIVGGGGSGATALATLNNNNQIATLAVNKPGSGYIAPPKITFNNGGSTTTPFAEAIIAKGKVIGVLIRNRGEGLQNVPTVTITGGQRVGGQQAVLTAEIANGRVAFVNVVTPGSGYVDPLSVVISPGAPFSRPITAWAPSGFIWSSLNDMATFARAALAQRQSPHTQQALIAEGFKIAERAYICTGNSPSLTMCPRTTPRGGLAWAIQAADPVTGFPKVISKDGGVPGYSTYLTLMPSRQLAVVVFVNSIAQIPGQTPAPAQTIASNILNAVFYQGGTGSDKEE